MHAVLDSVPITNSSMTNKNFSWRKNVLAPCIRPHSSRKLDVIEQYVRVYLKTLASDPRINNIALSIVDTFCGGGVYKNGISGKVEFGSPLRLVNIVRATESELAAERRKPFKILAKFYFSDASKEHVDFLTSELKKNGFREEIGKSICLTSGRSSDTLQRIVSQVRRSRGNTRSIFVLDQFGYKDVPMEDVRMILRRLPNAEIILTFSVDALLNFLTDKHEPNETLRQFGVNRELISFWRQCDRDRKDRAYAQKFVMDCLHRSSSVEFFTPFLLLSPDERRTIVLAHLSRHQRARDKMLGIHWDQQNSFRHHGSGSFYELGYDPRKMDYDDDLFSFREEDRLDMQRSLQDELPGRLFDMMNGDGIAVEEFLRAIGNKTAARNDDILKIVRQMAAARDVQVQRPDGKLRRRALDIGDRIIMPCQRKFVFVA